MSEKQTVSAFRNLLDTQYQRTITVKGEKVIQNVCKAYLTFEDVLTQMKMNFCKEEADTFILMLSCTRLPTREEQLIIEEKHRLAEEEKARKWAIAHPLPTKAEIAKANKIRRIRPASKPIYWDDPILGGDGEVHKRFEERKKNKSNEVITDE